MLLSSKCWRLSCKSLGWWYTMECLNQKDLLSIKSRNRLNSHSIYNGLVLAMLEEFWSEWVGVRWSRVSTLNHELICPGGRARFWQGWTLKNRGQLVFQSNSAFFNSLELLLLHFAHVALKFKVQNLIFNQIKCIPFQFFLEGRLINLKNWLIFCCVCLKHCFIILLKQNRLFHIVGI